MKAHCTYCGSKLHDIRTCPKTWAGSFNRWTLRCSYCGGRDHDEQACRKRHTSRAEQDRGIRIYDRNR